MDFWSVLIVVCLAVIVSLSVREHMKWKSFYESAGHKPKDVTIRYLFLRSNGVRCRLKSINHRIGLGVSGGSDLDTTVKLLVHKHDLHKAHDAMTEFNKEEARPYYINLIK
ncbi:hypothetical protein [Alkalibacillus aidingensis]|uniref:hypothetical protein n=1 Tax=Alkalibacillus aidingensis TaxID=2747607 RepID=UPI0016604E3D|nr:hypothetical protein [Alkalibacillus aidingensis]